MAKSSYQYKYHKEKYYAEYHDIHLILESWCEPPEMEDSDTDSVRQKKEREMYRKFDRFCERLNIGALAMRVFRFRFFEHGKWKDWDGEESRAKLTKIYSQTKEIIFHELKLNPGNGKEYIYGR
jgi:hypothetical protein